MSVSPIAVPKAVGAGDEELSHVMRVCASPPGARELDTGLEEGRWALSDGLGVDPGGPLIVKFRCARSVAYCRRSYTKPSQLVFRRFI